MATIRMTGARLSLLLLLMISQLCVQGFPALPASQRRTTPPPLTKTLFQASPPPHHDHHDREMQSRRQDVALRLGSLVVSLSSLGLLRPYRASAAATGGEPSLAELKAITKQARQELEPCYDLIENAKWDSVRTIVKRKPLVDMKNVALKVAELLNDDLQEEALEIRSDLTDHLQFLDMRVYNNVFVGEDRQILGTKIDYDTPKEELAKSKESLDKLLQLIEKQEKSKGTT